MFLRYFYFGVHYETKMILIKITSYADILIADHVLVKDCVTSPRGVCVIANDQGRITPVQTCIQRQEETKHDSSKIGLYYKEHSLTQHNR